MKVRIKKMKSKIADMKDLLQDKKCEHTRQLSDEILNADFELAQLIAKSVIIELWLY